MKPPLDLDPLRPAGTAADVGPTGRELVLDAIRVPASESPVPSLDRMLYELRQRSDPNQVACRRSFDWPWSAEALARARARALALEARVEIFRDNLRAIRTAHEVLNRAATARAVEAAETAVLDIHAQGESARLGIINRVHLEMAREFLFQLDHLDSLRGRLPAEVLDALRERALNEFTARMNRAARPDPTAADRLRGQP
jgi:hypothetical protein